MNYISNNTLYESTSFWNNMPQFFRLNSPPESGGARGGLNKGLYIPTDDTDFTDYLRGSAKKLYNLYNP